MINVKIYKLVNGKDTLAGSIAWDEGKVKLQGNSTLLKKMLKEVVPEISPKMTLRPLHFSIDPEAFLHNMCYQYRNAYLRATKPSSSASSRKSLLLNIRTTPFGAKGIIEGDKDSRGHRVCYDDKTGYRAECSKQPSAKPRRVPVVKPILPPPVPKSKNPPNPRDSLLKGNTVQEKLNNFKEGDEIVKKLASLEDKNFKDLRLAIVEANNLLQEYRKLPKGSVEKQTMAAKHSGLCERIKLIKKEAESGAEKGRQLLTQLLTNSKKLNLKASINTSGEQKISAKLAQNFNTARSWISNTWKESPLDSVRIQKFNVLPSKIGRSYYEDGNIFLQEEEGPEIAVHEMGHMLEEKSLGVRQVVDNFLRYRIGNEKSINLRDKFGDCYDSDEVGRKNHFDRYFGDKHAHYVGKEYEDNVHTEVLTMGMEALYRDPPGFCKADPEYAKFIIGVTSGRMRDYSGYSKDMLKAWGVDYE